MGDVSANVQAISTYTIGTSGTVTLAVYTILAATAAEQAAIDCVGFTDAQLTEATALYVCHLIARRLGKTGKTAESLGRGSYSKQLASGLTSWLDEYRDYIATVKTGGLITAEDLLGDSGAGYDHLDVEESKAFRLDQEPDHGQVTTSTGDLTGYFYGGN